MTIHSTAITLILPSVAWALSSTTLTPPSTSSSSLRLPDFEVLFDEFTKVSPLARNVINRQSGGFAAADLNQDSKLLHARIEQESHSQPTDLPWKTVENKPHKPVHRIDKLDHYQGYSAPLLRFRSTLQGPCNGAYFADFVMNYDLRQKWDRQIAQVYEAVPYDNMADARLALAPYGECIRLGAGYCQTKAAGMITSREQLTLCGIQEFADGSSIVWGQELDDDHNHLLPEGTRHTRARSRLFCTTLQPTSENAFDVEYCLQLDIGGKIPYWLNAPVVTETVKSLFKTANNYFGGAEGHMERFLEEQKKKVDGALLMTP